MVSSNPHLARLQSNYLFVEIGQRKQALLKKHPEARLISLGIGDTTEPLPQIVTESMAAFVQELGTESGYTGYQEGYGEEALRQSIVDRFYPGLASADEVFISDGSKCDIGRLQLLFGPQCTIGVQDPSYPAYIASSVIAGKTGEGDPQSGCYAKITYMPCTEENGFFPDLSRTPRADVLFFCSPNNPTGTLPERSQLEELVAFAKENRSIIVFDSAYVGFVQGEKSVRTLLEIDGAREVTLETGSFSKLVGFTGVRLGWTVVPKSLQFDDGSSVHQGWSRVMSTYFNGACNIAQKGGIAALSDGGWQEAQKLMAFYLQNTEILKTALEECGLRCYGGVHTPYLWVKVAGKSSWAAFEEILEKAHIVTTPGVGFGPSGEGFVRFSGFGRREEILEAAKRLEKLFA